MRVTPALIRKFLPHDSHGLAEVIVSHGELMQSFGIVTGRHLNFMLSNYYEETAGGKYLVERLNYSSPQRLAAGYPARVMLRGSTGKRTTPEGWPKAIAEDIWRDQTAIANAVYGKRFGNRPGTNDGWDYRGRGLTQLTFRDNYQEAKDFILRTCGVDIVANPDAVAIPKVALLTALFYWQRKGLNRFVAANDITGARAAINGGDKGLDSVKARVAIGRKMLPDWTTLEWDIPGTTNGDRAAVAQPVISVEDRASPALGRVAADLARAPTDWASLIPGLPSVAPAPQAQAPIPIGTPAVIPIPAGYETQAITDEDTIRAVQDRLIQKGYRTAVRPDGQIGDWTAQAIMLFRRKAGLPVVDFITPDLVLALPRGPDLVQAAIRTAASRSSLLKRLGAGVALVRAWLAAISLGGLGLFQGVIAWFQTPGNVDAAKGVHEQAATVLGGLGLTDLRWISILAVLAVSGYVIWQLRHAQNDIVDRTRKGDIL